HNNHSKLKKKADNEQLQNKGKKLLYFKLQQIAVCLKVIRGVLKMVVIFVFQNSLKKEELKNVNKSFWRGKRKHKSMMTMLRKMLQQCLFKKSWQVLLKKKARLYIVRCNRSRWGMESLFVEQDIILCTCCLAALA